MTDPATGRAAVGAVRLAWRRVDGDRAARSAEGHALMAMLAQEVSGNPGARIVSVCDRCGGDHGRPRAEGAAVRVSVSYAEDVVIAAAVPSHAAREVGVDIERLPTTDAPMTEVARLFAPLPPPTVREWTLLEAVLKADGRGLRVPVGSVVLGARTPSMLPGAIEVRVPDREQPFHAVGFDGVDGCAVSVAIVPVAESEP